MPSDIKETLSFLGKSLVTGMAPKIAGGLVNKLFHEWKIDVAQVTTAVNTNESLLGRLNESQVEQLQDVAALMDNLDFITVEWIVDSIKKDFPAIASLILNWPEARDWVSGQVEALKAEITLSK